MKKLLVVTVMLYAVSPAVASCWGADLQASATAAIDFINRRMDHCSDLPPGSVAWKSDAARFIQSYAPSTCESGSPVHAAYLYDQALALLAYLARGRPEDYLRAKMIADALVTAQNHDRAFTDGRLRNAYICGPPLDPGSGHTRLPGRWNAAANRFEEDEYAVGSDTGNMAWAAIALVQAHQLLPEDPKGKYLTAAERLAEWIVAHTTATDQWKGYYGGYSGWEKSPENPAGPARLTWRSTEHNIDLAVLFKLLENACGPDASKCSRLRANREHALQFIRHMWRKENSGEFLLTGLSPDAMTRNQSVIPLDAQTWSALALYLPGASAQSQRVVKALSWSLDHCRAKGIADAFDFNCRDGDGAWWEGTAQMALAMRKVAPDFPSGKQSAKKILARLQESQISTGPHRGGMPAASKCGLTTGFYKLWRSSQENLPWLYSNAPHVGATAWTVFALLGENPFDLSEKLPDVSK